MKRSGTQNTPAVRLENTAVVHCGFCIARRQFVVTSVPKLHLAPLPVGRGVGGQSLRSRPILFIFHRHQDNENKKA
jgi:hypothetical protein